MSLLLKKSTLDEVGNKWFECVGNSIHSTSPIPLIYSFRRSEKEIPLSEERISPPSQSPDVSGQAESESTTIFVTDWSVLEESELQKMLKTGINYDFVVDWF